MGDVRRERGRKKTQRVGGVAAEKEETGVQKIREKVSATPHAIHCKALKKRRSSLYWRNLLVFKPNPEKHFRSKRDLCSLIPLLYLLWMFLLLSLTRSRDENIIAYINNEKVASPPSRFSQIEYFRGVVISCFRQRYDATLEGNLARKTRGCVILRWYTLR